jgi:hypothetical protein
MKTLEIKYIDHKAIYIVYLENYPAGVHMIKDKVITVTEKEKNRLFKMRNGKNEVWEVKRSRKQEDHDGNR